MRRLDRDYLLIGLLLLAFNLVAFIAIFYAGYLSGRSE